MPDWASESLPALSDPLESEHTLRWLFDRSVRGLNPTARQALASAGLLASKPFPSAAIVAALGNAESARSAIKTLVHRSLLMSAQQDHWQWTHILAYRFARQEEKALDPSLLAAPGGWLDQYLRAQLSHAPTSSTADALEHLAALLRVDEDQSLWQPLVHNGIYEFCDRLISLGSLVQAKRLLDAVDGWFAAIPPTKVSDSHWLREQTALRSRQGNILQEQGDLTSALAAFQSAFAISQKLSNSDPSNTDWQRNLSVSHEKIGNILQAQGDLTAALAGFSIRPRHLPKTRQLRSLQHPMAARPQRQPRKNRQHPPEARRILPRPSPPFNPHSPSAKNSPTQIAPTPNGSATSFMSSPPLPGSTTDSETKSRLAPSQGRVFPSPNASPPSTKPMQLGKKTSAQAKPS